MSLPFFPKPMCEKPSLLVNRNAVALWLNGGLLYTPNDHDGKHCPFHDKNAFDWKGYCRKGYALGTRKMVDGVERTIFEPSAIEVLRHYYVKLGDRFEFFYQLVPCGHCILCDEKRINSFANRASLENQSHDNKCIFVTLTYDNFHIPTDEKGLHRGIECAERYQQWFDTIGYRMTYEQRLCQPQYQEMNHQRGQCKLVKKDIQNFLKRLRQVWERHPNKLMCDGNHFRFFEVGEYGGKFGHPHFHLMLWGYPYPIVNDYCFREIDQLKKDIIQAWSKYNRKTKTYECFADAERVDVQVARDCARYVAKYVSKQGEKAGFQSASNRGGGIGAPFIMSQQPYYLAHPTMQEFIYTDRWSGKVEQITMGQYITNKLFPPMRTLLGAVKPLGEMWSNRIRLDMTYYKQLYQNFEITRQQAIEAIAKCELELAPLMNIYSPCWHIPANQIDIDTRVYHHSPKQVPFNTSRWFTRAYTITPSGNLYFKVGETMEVLDSTMKQQLMDAIGNLDIDNFNKMVELRQKHVTFIPTQLVTDDMIKLKKVKKEEKRISRKNREKF